MFARLYAEIIRLWCFCFVKNEDALYARTSGNGAGTGDTSDFCAVAGALDFEKGLITNQKKLTMAIARIPPHDTAIDFPMPWSQDVFCRSCTPDWK
jgi:hypothetical protein